MDEEQEIMESIREVLDLEQAARLMEIARKVRHDQLTPTGEQHDESEEEEESSEDEGFSWDVEGDVSFSLG